MSVRPVTVLTPGGAPGGQTSARLLRRSMRTPPNSTAAPAPDDASTGHSPSLDSKPAGTGLALGLPRSYPPAVPRAACAAPAILASVSPVATLTGCQAPVAGSGAVKTVITAPPLVAVVATYQRVATSPEPVRTNAGFRA